MFTALLGQRLHGRYNVTHISQFQNIGRAMTTSQLKEYYFLLNVDKNASPKEIKESFLRLSKIYHPDNKESGSHLKFVKLKEAFDAIKDGYPIVTDSGKPYAPDPYTSYDEYEDLSHRAHAYHRNRRRDFKTGFRNEQTYGFGGPYSNSSTPWEDLKRDREYRRRQYDQDSFGHRGKPFVNLTILMSATAWIVIYSSVLLFWENRGPRPKANLTSFNGKNYPDYQSYEEYLRKRAIKEKTTKDWQFEEEERSKKETKSTSDSSDNTNNNDLQK